MTRLNLYFVATVAVIACGSIPKGYDEGGFAAASGLDSFLHDFHLARSIPHSPSAGSHGTPATAAVSGRGVVTSLGVLGAAAGAVAACALTDRLGRLRAWQAFAVVWMTGFLTATLASGNLGLLLFARVWGGVGAGGLTVVAPLYLAEIARARSRGMIVSVYMVVLLSFLMAGFFISYAALATMPATRSQYRVVLAVPQIPVGLALVASLFLDDTPRWLASRGRSDEALAALARLRGSHTHDPAVVGELGDMEKQVDDERQALAGATVWAVAREVATASSLRRRFLLGMAMQAVAQWSGGNAITYYAPEVFRLAGVATRRQSLVTAGSYGAVKLLFTALFTWALVDRLGRRRCFLAGLTLQGAAHVYMAVYMALWRHRSGVRDAHYEGAAAAASHASASTHASAAAAASHAAVASVFVYAIGWSIGLCTVQYLYGAETLPTRVRGVCYAATMAVHWLFQFAVVCATPALFRRLDVWGAYALWACVCAVGLVGLGLWAPETKGVPMERMGELFSTGPWYTGWRARLAPTSADVVAAATTPSLSMSSSLPSPPSSSSPQGSRSAAGTASGSTFARNGNGTSVVVDGKGGESGGGIWAPSKV